MADVILGIQIGTSKVRVKAYDLAGNLQGKDTQLIRIYHPYPQYHEIDAQELWAGTCAAIKNCIQNMKNTRILSIGISSVGESHVLLDRHGDPLERIITWYDQRAIQQAAALRQCVGEDRIYAITGQFVSPKFGICKAMWVRDNTPEVYSRVAHLLTLHDYIIYRLTGRMMTEYSMASRMMCFNIEKMEWSEELLKFARLPKDCLPEVFPGGSPAGIISREASRLTDLAEGTPVFAGGHDHACAAVAVDIFQDNVMLDSMGSAETTVVATETRLDIDKGFRNQIAVYPHFGSKPFRAVTSIQAFGVVFDWLKQWICAGDQLNSDEELQRLLRQMDITNQTPRKLLFMPHLRGLQEAPKAMGTFFGIDENCGCQDMIRAVAEGMSFELCRRTAACENAFDRDFFSIRAVGEYSSLPTLMYLKSAIVAKEIETIPQTDAITFGAALMGALGAGILAELDLQDVFQPNAGYASDYKTIQKYRSKYEQYLNVHEQLLGIYSSVDMG
jgi:Sugar (pentulose and hexulose) kinases